MTTLHRTGEPPSPAGERAALWTLLKIQTRRARHLHAELRALEPAAHQLAAERDALADQLITTETELSRLTEEPHTSA